MVDVTGRAQSERDRQIFRGAYEWHEPSVWFAGKGNAVAQYCVISVPFIRMAITHASDR